MRLRQEEMKGRREAVIWSAFQLFCGKGIEAAKMAEIAQKAGVSEATVYRYFENKETLVLETFMKLWDTIMSSVHKGVEETPGYASMSGYEQIREWIEGFRHLYRSDDDFVIFSYEVKLYLLRHGVKLDKNQQHALMQEFYAPFLAALDKGKEDGSIPTSEDSQDLFYAIWGSIRGYVVKIVIYGRLYEEESPWENCYQVMKEGILSALSAGWSSAKKENKGERDSEEL